MALSGALSIHVLILGRHAGLIVCLLQNMHVIQAFAISRCRGPREGRARYYIGDTVRGVWHSWKARS